MLPFSIRFQAVLCNGLHNVKEMLQLKSMAPDRVAGDSSTDPRIHVECSVCRATVTILNSLHDDKVIMNHKGE